MIHAPSNYKKTRKTEGIKIPSSKVIGKEKKEVLSLLKKALLDLREGLSNSKDSYLHKTSEQKLNYLNELLKERIKSQGEEIQKQISSYTVKLTEKEKRELLSELKRQFTDFAPSIVEGVLECLEDTIKTYKSSEEKGDTDKSKVQVKISEKVDEDFLEQYFDNLYKKSEKYQNLKDTIINEMTESHNQNMRLIKERVQQYKDNLKNYEQKIIKANSKISELQDKLSKTQKNSALKNNFVNKDKEDKNKEKAKNSGNNLIKDNLLTQQIVDQVRRNENLAVAPKDKQLSPEHTKSANNLIDKFYKNGLIELKLKNWKNTFKGISKIFGMILSPIGWLAGKVFGAAKSIGLSLFKLGKFVFNSFQSIFLIGLMSPAGAYTIGFLAGFISEYIKDKWTNKEGLIGGLHSFWDGVVKYFINPLVEVAKLGFKLGSFIIDMVAKHPLIFGGLFLLLKGIWWAIKNFSTISKGFSIAKKGFKFTGPFLVGLATSAASEVIFNKTVFKEDDEEKLTYNKDLQAKYAEFSSQVNGDTIANMNAIDGNRYSKLKDSMDEEYDTIGKIQEDLEFMSKYYKSDNDDGKRVSILGGDLVKAVFDSRLYGFDEKEYRKYMSKESGMEKVNDQISYLTTYLNTRTSMLARQMGVLSAASKQSVSVMYDTLGQMVEEYKDDDGNVKIRMKQEATQRLKKHGIVNAANETDIQSFGFFNSEHTGVESYNNGKVVYREDRRNFNETGSRGLREEFSNPKYSLNMVDSKGRTDGWTSSFVTKHVEDPRERALLFTEKYMRQYNMDNVGFVKQMGDLTKEFTSAIESSSGNQKLLEKNLTEYLDKVREEYRRKNQSDIQNLREDIKKSEDNIGFLSKELEELEKELKEYKQKGMTNG